MAVIIADDSTTPYELTLADGASATLAVGMDGGAPLPSGFHVGVSFKTAGGTLVPVGYLDATAPVAVLEAAGTFVITKLAGSGYTVETG